MPKPEHAARTTWPPCCCSSSQDNTWAQRGWDRGGSGQGGLTGGLLSALMCITALLLTTNRFVLWGSKKTVISDSDNSSSAASFDCSRVKIRRSRRLRVCRRLSGDFWDCWVMLRPAGGTRGQKVTTTILLSCDVKTFAFHWNQWCHHALTFCLSLWSMTVYVLSLCLSHFMGSEKQQITDSGAH